MDLGVGLGLAKSRKAGAPPTPGVATDIQLTNTTLRADGFSGMVVANIYSSGYPSPTYTKQADPDSKFTVSGSEVLLAAAPGAGPHLLTIRATNASGTYDEQFSFSVTAATGQMRGINLAGGEFDTADLPGVLGTNYAFSSNAVVDYWAEKGFNTVRIPFRWERMQRTLGAALSTSDCNAIEAVIQRAQYRGMYALLDCHNYGRYGIDGVGSFIVGETVNVTSAHYADFWSRMVTRFGSYPHVIWDLMNEPNNQNYTTLVECYNEAIVAIRAAGSTHPIMVCGGAYSAAHTWTSSAGTYMLNVTDSGNNLYMQPHGYLDSDNSGTSASCTIGGGVSRLTSITQWARDNNKRLFLGEFNGGNNGTCLNEIEERLDYIDANSDVWKGWTAWDGGNRFSTSYMFRLYPVTTGVDQGQTPYLVAHRILPATDLVAPTITSSASVSNTENVQLLHKLTSNKAVTWSVQGGADAADFEVSGQYLRWVSNGTKDYDAPDDANTDNSYVVTVRATDYWNNTTDQTITVGVTDTDDESGWYEDAAYADMAVVADFNNDRYAITEVVLGSVAGATAAALKVKRAATFEELFAFTCTSSTARTYLSQAGVLTNDLIADQRRMTWENGKRQLRLENASSNTTTNATDLSGWDTTGILTKVLSGSFRGVSNATLVTESTSTGSHFIRRAAGGANTFTIGTSYTWSFDAKAGTATVVQATMSTTGASFDTTHYANFDLSNGTVSATGAGATASISSLGNSEYRCTITCVAIATAIAPAGGWPIIGLTNNNTSATRLPTYTGTGMTIYLGNTQLETVPFATDFIPSGSRAVETCRLSPIVEAILQRSAASVVVRGQKLQIPAGGRLVGATTTTSLLEAVSNTTVASNGAAPVATLGAFGTVTGAFGVAMGFDGTGRSVAANGGTIATDATGAPSRTTIYLGRHATAPTNSNYGSAFYDFFAVVPERSSNATLQAQAVAAT